MRNYMIDIETCGLAHNSVVWAVAIQPFILVGSTTSLDGPGKMVLMDPAEQLQHAAAGRLVVNEETIRWTQSHGDAENFMPWWQAFNSGGEVDMDFSVYSIADLALEIRLHNGSDNNALFWCKGKEFDFSILKYQFALAGRNEPWHYKNLMCMRTMDGLLRHGIGADSKRPAPSHNALEDAQAQVHLLGDNLRAYDNMRGIA